MNESEAASNAKPLLCALPQIKERDLDGVADPERSRLIRLFEKKWVSGTNLTYFFFQEPAEWRGGSAQENAVRNAFEAWKNLGIGLTFQEVDAAEAAIIRIGFDQSDGSWSYVGRDCVDIATDPRERTTNFGWDLTTRYGRDTALHELGHVLGFPHEHQNPRAGIVWDEIAVYRSFAGAPNFWSREVTDWNILRKIPANTVDGSVWDKDSIMHYQFEAGLITEPMVYQSQPLIPEDGLSSIDIETVKELYPPQQGALTELVPFESKRFDIAAGEQLDFVIEPSVSRQYTLETFGKTDTVMVLFEMIDDTPQYLDGDDDSGLDFNAKLSLQLLRGRTYIVRIRLYYAQEKGSGALMLY